MNREIRIVNHPKNLNKEWDIQAKWYHLKTEFLTFLHNYNFCNQHYYELYKDSVFAAGTIVYPFKTNILTFSRFNLYLKMKVIGLPVSIATVPLVGESSEYEYLLTEILKREKGLILGLNFTTQFLKHQVINMRTLPTIVINRSFENFEEYLNGLRHPYRRRLLRFREKFQQIHSTLTTCASFNEVHYRLYLDVMNRTKTKLETLSLMLFKNLPGNFILTTHYLNDTMLAWHICTSDRQAIFFFMGGVNYEFRDKYKSYHNNLISILHYAYSNKFNCIDLGQTAEIAKMRMGGIEDERKLFLYHKNAFFLFLIKLFKGLLEYSKVQGKLHVFREP
jgi:hypothetical protein